MAVSRIIHGARAVLHIADETGALKAVGIFNSVSVSSAYDTQAPTILGRFSPAELIYTGAEVVEGTVSGYRVLKNGALSIIPKLQDLLNPMDYTLTILDRVDNKTVIMQISKCKFTGFSSQVASRQLQDMSLRMQGLVYDEEGLDNTESANSVQLPPEA